MIPRAYITEWRKNVPWQTSEQVEQDIIISQALIKIYQDDYLSSHLAFRGGTALYKLFLNPATRYSEDIDLVQIEAGPIKKTVQRLQYVFTDFGKSKVKRVENSFKLIYHYSSEIEPVQKMKLKVEVNSREHFAVLGWNSVHFSMESLLFTGQANITTYKLEELLGTKMRALYQRSKGRDLYDLYKFLATYNLNSDQIIQCYKTYIEFSLRDTEKYPPTKVEYENNLMEKLIDPAFLGDTKALLSPDETYNPRKAFELMKTNLIDKI